MAINKKLIHFLNKSNFLSKLEAGEILDTSIVFIKDAKQIWTHGQLYSCPYNEEEINTLFTGENIKLINYVEIESPVDILPTDTINQAFGKIEEYLNSYAAEITAELSKKVDTIEGKGLSTEDFTTALKNKLSGLTNYDDTTIKQSITKIQTLIDTLVNANASAAIDTFNEIVAFLEGIENSTDLDSIIAAIELLIALRYTKPADGIPASDLSNSVLSALNKANTALQSYTEKYTGTITGITMNGVSKGTSGVVDLGTVLTEHQDISGKLDSKVASITYLKKTDAANTYLPIGDYVILVDTEEEADDPIVSEYVTLIQLENKLLNKQDTLVSGINIKTINGESILGEGDIAISGAYAEVNHGTGYTTFTLTPNTFHVWDRVASLDLSFANEQVDVTNEYTFQFTSGATPTSLTLPDTIQWVNGAPNIEANKTYQVSIVNNIGLIVSV